MTVDLSRIEGEWLQQCGSCDAGLPMSCTCPDGDPRNVIANLVETSRRTRELLRRVVMDYGNSQCPDGCVCSLAQARAFLAGDAS